MHWMLNGDSNTRYFHNSIKVRHHKNRVRSILDTSANSFTDQKDFENCFLDFYKTLWFPPFPLTTPVILISIFKLYRMTLMYFLTSIASL